MKGKPVIPQAPENAFWISYPPIMIEHISLIVLFFVWWRAGSDGLPALWSIHTQVPR
jgi:hypothetical protein